MPLPQRLKALQAALAWAEGVRPSDHAPTIALRLRIAEATDGLGQRRQAQAQLLAVRQLVKPDDCAGALGDVLSAQAWMHVAHGEAAQAVALLEGDPACGAEVTSGQGRLAMDHGWALLMAGRTADGVAAIKRAAYRQPSPLPMWRRVLGAKPGKAYLLYPMDMAYALQREGREAEARQLLAQPEAGWVCSAPGVAGQYHERWAWQGRRDEVLGEVRGLCGGR